VSFVMSRVNVSFLSCSIFFIFSLSYVGVGIGFRV
jgi:hypothetical protein